MKDSALRSHDEKAQSPKVTSGSPLRVYERPTLQCFGEVVAKTRGGGAQIFNDILTGSDPGNTTDPPTG